ncbi:MAG: hypothetical protein EI684_13375 [Candidatus Viridilinea halotolerans]|uniref:Uncharacterized protein n=1 Tax=Candidatus Viridilinea halotolerans TaxID=2491704 RepID=A0A426TXH6_9CHLR|nr:MAG: hypothetical protein EI684_13375 [Candidatus Viridilinea halotolerans]
MRRRDDEWIIPLSPDDPLHAEMLSYLQAIRIRGRYSPVRRILARWAANGYLLEMGRVPGGMPPDADEIMRALATMGLLADHATADAVADALGSMTRHAAPARTASGDLAQVREEIAALEASAAAIDFE